MGNEALTKGGAVDIPDAQQWMDEVGGEPGSDAIGMMLVHQGIVRGTTRSGEPVTGMDLAVDRQRLEQAIGEARSWQGVCAVRVWVNEGALAVGDPIMKVLVAGDIRENVFGGLQRLVGILKTEVVTEAEHRS
jgi:molybdopterin synthase catalytic subunit